MGIISDLKTNDSYVNTAAQCGASWPANDFLTASFPEDPDRYFFHMFLTHRYHVAQNVAKRHESFNKVLALIAYNRQTGSSWEKLIDEFELIASFFGTAYRVDHSYIALLTSYAGNLYRVTDDPTTKTNMNRVLDELDRFDDTSMYGFSELHLVSSALWFANRNNFQVRVMEKYPDMLDE